MSFATYFCSLVDVESPFRWIIMCQFFGGLGQCTSYFFIGRLGRRTMLLITRDQYLRDFHAASRYRVHLSCMRDSKAAKNMNEEMFDKGTAPRDFSTYVYDNVINAREQAEEVVYGKKVPERVEVIHVKTHVKTVDSVRARPSYRELRLNHGLRGAALKTPTSEEWGL
ncbi:hypothetical protein AYL99_02981 [Fonsecaea erecta]|uniref:Uncharacterized protein n=1 Tax=Fonsecaea erecta TaxID=1367422 RepID=A0A178ZVD6_9EURO|nr:hypothetical protein AYL99_02981 [Fonsecaea erecta]OAP63754.1 hypothetical protein AYL99_02981 [Fonsecaea erecta]